MKRQLGRYVTLIGSPQHIHRLTERMCSVLGLCGNCGRTITQGQPCWKCDYDRWQTAIEPDRC